MEYFYIHGLHSTGKQTSKKLQKILNQKVNILTWDCKDTFANNRCNLYFDLVNKKDVILIASSLGALYAIDLSKWLQVPCILINPVINAQKTYNHVQDMFFFKYLKFLAFLRDINVENLMYTYPIKTLEKLNNPTLVIVGEKDNIVNPWYTLKNFNCTKYLIAYNEKHQIKDFYPLKSQILKFIQENADII